MSIEGAADWQKHTPVLLEEVIRWLRPEEGGAFIDCTVGAGGHSEAFLEASPGTRVIGIDRDPLAIAKARRRLARFETRFEAVQANFDELAAVMKLKRLSEARAILADLGVSSMQLDSPERGFSFASDASLDMRMDSGQGETAAELIARLTERELADMIFEYGEERGARRVARAIVRERERRPVMTTRQLADIVVRALRVPGRWRIHPATRTFQAIRIAVNDELGALKRLIPEAVSHLEPGGRLAIISFHSLEDRIVKQGFQRESGRCDCPPEIRAGRLRGSETAVCSGCGARKRVAVLTKKPVTPSRKEMESNPRSRSARLRVCERLKTD
ncbi:MAG TPA: 16S rRNA (cytosine(1402)-N(4))-methyltransferase RsmH [Blastocatellia bacterium]|nr:16S rRNA (cytosine(1402)-N(4))-methyltransferase RsmH [Blastocatellia bacterium]